MSDFRLYNTLTRQVEPFAPADGRTVRMYTCGPTVYRYAHVGNLRSYLLADLIRRVLLHHGLDVFHVKNITDVGHLRHRPWARERLSVAEPRCQHRSHDGLLREVVLACGGDHPRPAASRYA